MSSFSFLSKDESEEDLLVDPEEQRAFYGFVRECVVSCWDEKNKGTSYNRSTLLDDIQRKDLS